MRSHVGLQYERHGSTAGSGIRFEWRIPVIDDLGLARAEERDEGNGISVRIQARLVAVINQHMACEPIRIIAAAPEGPLACQAVAIPNWNRFAGREPAARHNRLRIGEHLCGTLITDDLAKES